MLQNLAGWLQVLKKLRVETCTAFPRNGAQLMITVEQSSFLTWLVATLGVRKAVEVGTFTGLSALAVAQVPICHPYEDSLLPAHLRHFMIVHQTAPASTPSRFPED